MLPMNWPTEELRTNMKLSYKHVLPFAISLLSHLQEGIDELKDKGMTVNEESFRFFVKHSIKDWNPKIKGISIIDDKTREHAVLFISGIALNIINGEKNEQ
jgi:hypothetical protein